MKIHANARHWTDDVEGANFCMLCIEESLHICIIPCGLVFVPEHQHVFEPSRADRFA